MALTQSLVQKQTQSQRLVMTPDLRQSIELLPLSTVELAEKIQSELLDNPLLAEINNPEKQLEPQIFSHGEQKKIEKSQYQESIDENIRQSYTQDKPGRYDSEASDRNQKFIEQSTESINLTDSLLSQIRLLTITEREYLAAELLISMLDEKGFLKHDLIELSKEMSIPIKTLNKLKKLIQKLEPIGTCTSGIQETLVVQAEILYPENNLLIHILSNHFLDLEKLDFKKISKAMKITEEEIEEIAKIIKTLHPYPANLFNNRKIDYVVPDVMIIEDETGHSIIINDEWLPKLAINEKYKKALVESKNPTDREYMTTKVNSAQRLIRSINQRRQTLYRVVSCILEFQMDFFKHGITQIRPLTLRDISEKLDMSESTVSRITTNKYVQTSWGVFELKWFFSSGVRSSSGEFQSSKKVHDMIKNLIKDEDELNPLSDQDIVDLLGRQEIMIARRTVAKYRKTLKILPAGRRKRVKS
ncbi:MAG: RNA polymerase factor sigma-54 [Leptospiraceae bacterium]|nr:RNA polymerase factor sigma-54 [Leptospiraceae bacterium]